MTENSTQTTKREEGEVKEIAEPPVMSEEIVGEGLVELGGLKSD